mmetsp:Transcript_31027/g.98547  ORF Transcript_31027/g.98547 Transcript_31027/m.98547 type:complete len:273 (+) Transcript_31027:59-877(+)
MHNIVHLGLLILTRGPHPAASGTPSALQRFSRHAPRLRLDVRHGFLLRVGAVLRARLLAGVRERAEVVGAVRLGPAPDLVLPAVLLHRALALLLQEVVRVRGLAHLEEIGREVLHLVGPAALLAEALRELRRLELEVEAHGVRVRRALPAHERVVPVRRLRPLQAPGQRLRADALHVRLGLAVDGDEALAVLRGHHRLRVADVLGRLRHDHGPVHLGADVPGHDDLPRRLERRLARRSQRRLLIVRLVHARERPRHEGLRRRQRARPGLRER